MGAAQADPLAVIQALATGRPLEERGTLACDWLSLLPAIRRRVASPTGSHPGVWPVLELSRSDVVRNLRLVREPARLVPRPGCGAGTYSGAETRCLGRADVRPQTEAGAYTQPGRSSAWGLGAWGEVRGRSSGSG